MLRNVSIVHSFCSIAPADVSGGFERSSTKVWDSQTIRWTYSSIMTLSQDTLRVLWQSLGLYFPASVSMDNGASLIEKQKVSEQIMFLPSFSPGPLLVLLVTSVMFVF